jgi:hypothetical protein
MRRLLVSSAPSLGGYGMPLSNLAALLKLPADERASWEFSSPRQSRIQPTRLYFRACDVQIIVTAVMHGR